MMRGNSYDDEDDNFSPATDSQLVNAGMYIYLTIDDHLILDSISNHNIVTGYIF
jgi:hypothetical protein